VEFKKKMLRQVVGELRNPTIALVFLIRWVTHGTHVYVCECGANSVYVNVIV
jgi:hypothetical protein